MRKKPVEVIKAHYHCDGLICMDYHMMRMINRALRVDLQMDKLRFNTEYDTEEHAFRRWLEVTEDFPLHHDGKELTMMKKGMRIQTEISRKFTDERMQTYAKGAGAAVEQVETADGYYKCAIFRPNNK